MNEWINKPSITARSILNDVCDKDMYFKSLIDVCSTVVEDWNENRFGGLVNMTPHWGSYCVEITTDPEPGKYYTVIADVYLHDYLEHGAFNVEDMLRGMLEGFFADESNIQRIKEDEVDKVFVYDELRKQFFWSVSLDSRAAAFMKMVEDNRNTREVRNLEDKIKEVIFNDPATIVLWKDGTKTVVKCGPDDEYDPEKGLALCMLKKQCGNKGNYNNLFRKYLPKEEKPFFVRADGYVDCPVIISKEAGGLEE